MDEIEATAHEDHRVKRDVPARPPHRRALWIATVVLLLWGLVVFRPAGLPWVSRIWPGLAPREPMMQQSRRLPMPALSLDRLNGGTWRLEQDRGRVVVLNFWATWCGPCVAEMPALARLQASDAARGLEVVGVAMDGNGGDRGRETIRRFTEAMGLNYVVALPPEMSQIEAGMEALPTTILIDRRGRVARTYIGAVTEPGFSRDVDTLLNEIDP